MSDVMKVFVKCVVYAVHDSLLNRVFKRNKIFFCAT